MGSVVGAFSCNQQHKKKGGAEGTLTGTSIISLFVAGTK